MIQKKSLKDAIQNPEIISVVGEPIVEVSKKNKEESTFVPVPLLFPVGKKVYPTDFVYSDNCDYAVVKPASKLSIKIKC